MLSREHTWSKVHLRRGTARSSSTNLQSISFIQYTTSWNKIGLTNICSTWHRSSEFVGACSFMSSREHTWSMVHPRRWPARSSTTNLRSIGFIQCTTSKSLTSVFILLFSNLQSNASAQQDIYTSLSCKWPSIGNYLPLQKNPRILKKKVACNLWERTVCIRLDNLNMWLFKDQIYHTFCGDTLTKNHVSSNNTVQDNQPCKYWLLLGDGGAKCHTGYPENFAAPEVAQPEWDRQLVLPSWKKDNDNWFFLPEVAQH